jgi:TonB-dependent SusC/RagA subfamily outer membrane receptor
MRKFYSSFLTCLLLASSIQLTAQSGFENADSLAGRFIKDLRSDTREKLFVQTNKWFYVAGEEIWMKAWIVNALSHKYYSHSQTLYADLVDERDTAVAQLLFNIPLQQTEGYIALPASLPEGYYWLRVYTANMLRNDPGSVFVLPLYVVNNRYPSKLTAEPVVNTTADLSNEPPQVDFFPEGGAMISGTNSVIGLRASDKAGGPLALEGYITDSWDSVVTTFKSDARGLGSCSFYVFKSRKYIAHVKWNKQLLSWPLPAINQYASQLSIKEQDANNIKVIVSLGDSLYKKGRTSYLLGISRDSLCFASVGSDMYEVNISKKNFPAGRANLILFNDRQEVVSERAVFISKPNDEVAIQTDKDNYGARDKVAVSITTGDSLRHPSLAALSVSVTDDSLVQEPLLLRSNNIDSSDLLMLTQPQQFTGKTYNQSISYAAVKKTVLEGDSSITDISGRILNRRNQPVAGRIVTLYTKQQFNLFVSDTTDSNGAFKFHLPPYPDSVAFTLQVSNLKGVKVDEKIIVDAKSPFPKFTTPQSLKKKLSLPQTAQVQTFRTKHLDNMILGTGKEWLKEVFVKAKRKETSYNTSKRVSNFSYVLTGEKIQQMSPNEAGPALLMVPGLHLKGGFLTLGGLTSFGASSGDEPLLVVDGVPVQTEASPALVTPPAGSGGFGPVIGLDASSSTVSASKVLQEISKIPPDVIDFIEVLKGPEAAYYGSRASNGVILVNTHRFSNYRNRLESYGTLQYSPKSYYLAPHFNMPDYTDKDLKKASFKDYRTTLFWNGHVYSDPNGKATVEFFTADLPTTYTITVTGVTAAGDIIYKKAKINRN